MEGRLGTGEDGDIDPEGDITQEETWPVISSYFRCDDLVDVVYDSDGIEIRWNVLAQEK